MRSDAFKKAASEQARARPRKYATKQGKETKKKEHKNIYSVVYTCFADRTFGARFVEQSHLTLSLFSLFSLSISDDDDDDDDGFDGENERRSTRCFPRKEENDDVVVVVEKNKKQRFKKCVRDDDDDD